MTSLLVNLINIYQHYLSPDHSFWAKSRYPFGYCHFYPSCSEYTKQALIQHGLIGGGVRAIWRILSCNPFTTPAIDRVRKRS